MRVQCTSSMALPKLFCGGASRYFGRCTREEEEKGARGLKAHKGTCGSLDRQKPSSRSDEPNINLVRALFAPRQALTSSLCPSLVLNLGPGNWTWIYGNAAVDLLLNRKIFQLSSRETGLMKARRSDARVCIRAPTNTHEAPISTKTLLIFSKRERQPVSTATFACSHYLAACPRPWHMLG